MSNSNLLLATVKKCVMIFTFVQGLIESSAGFESVQTKAQIHLQYPYIHVHVHACITKMHVKIKYTYICAYN